MGIGTIVHAINLASGQAETFTILGAWDSKPEAGVISYLSPGAQSLLGHKPGDEVEFELEGAKHRHRIETVQPYRPAVEPSPAALVALPAEEVLPPVQPMV